MADAPDPAYVGPPERLDGYGTVDRHFGTLGTAFRPEWLCSMQNVLARLARQQTFLIACTGDDPSLQVLLGREVAQIMRGSLGSENFASGRRSRPETSSTRHPRDPMSGRKRAVTIWIKAAAAFLILLLATGCPLAFQGSGSEIPSHPKATPQGATGVEKERRGKDLIRAEVPESALGKREYIWAPYLYHDPATTAERQHPNITTPGADTANFPNSAFTLPAGRSYFETSPVGYYASSPRTPAQYNWELFYRYGLTDNLEFRFFNSGLTVVDSTPAALGFSPVTFDLKYNLWESNPEYWIPAVGVETYVQTTWGSPALASGTQVAWSVNVDHSLPFGLALEWNIGLTKIFSHGLDVLEENSSWALQRDVTEDLAIFLQGYHNAAGLPRGSTRLLDAARGFRRIGGHVLGAGLIWTVSDAMEIFGSLNGGNSGAPAFIGLAGFALAF